MKKILLILLVLFTFQKFYSLPKQAEKILVTNSKSQQQINSKNEFDWQKNMPWIGAIIIGGLTVFANLLISQQSRKSNKETIILQLNNAKDIALTQIENSRRTVQMEFNKTVLSGNRQAWINDLRDNISKIISKLTTCSLSKKITMDELGEIDFLITKVEFMLNAEKDKVLISVLNDLLSCALKITLNQKTFADLAPFSKSVKNLTQSTLKTEWERVKIGE